MVEIIKHVARNRASCHPEATLIPRDDLGEAGLFAVCFTCGRLHQKDAIGQYGLASSDVLVRIWQAGGSRTQVSPDVRIDLSKEGYA